MPFVELSGAQIEYQRIPGTQPVPASPIVMLHEGLGCIATWKDFPMLLGATTGREVIVYSRLEYGRSSPISGPRPIRYMHHEAIEVLPGLLVRWNVENPILFGHSDGASIALIHAGAGLPVASLIVLAPHVLVETLSITGIEAAREAYLNTGLRDRLAPYHRDVDGAFWGWNDVWRDDAAAFAARGGSRDFTAFVFDPL